MSKNQEKIMRCEALFHLIKVKTFTKQHLIRVVYINETGVEVSTNALDLKFSSIRLDDKAGREIVYIRYNFMTGIHVLFRSGCTLERHNANGECHIKNEIILSWIEIGHLEELINQYLSFTEGIENFNLTSLRKIASKKSSNKIKDVMLQNQVHVDIYGKGNEDNCLPLGLSMTHHILELQLHVGSVVFSHQQYNISLVDQGSLDYLVKNDILSYIDFLRLNQIILAYEINQRNCIKPNSSLTQQSSLLKLDYICEQLASDREGKTNKLRKKRKFQETCDTPLQEGIMPSKNNENDAVVVDCTNDLFHFDNLEF